MLQTVASVLLATLFGAGVSAGPTKPTSDAAPTFFERASTLYAAKNDEALERLCKSALEEGPDRLDAAYFLAATRLDRGDDAGAKPYLETFERLHADAERQMSDEAHTEVLLVDAHFGPIYFYLAEMYYRARRFRDALPWFRRAKSFYPDDPLLNALLGITYKELGDYTNALKYMQRQRELNPDDPSALYNIACVYANQRAVEQALLWLRMAIQARAAFRQEAQADPDFTSLRNNATFRELTKAVAVPGQHDGASPPK